MSLVPILSYNDSKSEKMRRPQIACADELLKKLKFKVMFSADHLRQNLKDYVFRIYKSLKEQSKEMDGQEQSPPLFKAYLKLSKNKRILELNVTQIVGSS